MKRILSVIAAITLLTGCYTTMNKSTVTETDLLHHRFELVNFDGKAVESFKEKPMVIEFGEKLHVSGTMCNQFFGQATLKDDVLSSKALASTRMLCASSLRNELDAVIGKVFAEGAKVELKDNILTLKSKDHTLVYKLKDLVK